MATTTWVGVLSPSDQLSVPFAQSHLRLPADGLDFRRQLFQTELQMAANLGRVPIGPGAFDERAPGVVFPALVMPPCRRRSPDEYSEGVRPR